MDTTKPTIKQNLSAIKQDWVFEDYPIKTWKNPNAGQDKVAYGAGITNWSIMVGHGDTPEAALSALKERFERYKDNNDDLPQPGSEVPLKFASTANIDKYEKTAVAFFRDILSMDYYDGFFSDESTLAHFKSYNNDDTADRKMKEEIIKMTLLHYNVDITDIYDNPLWEILSRIDAERSERAGL